MTLKPWTVLDSKYMIQDRWMTLRADRCQTSGGHILDPYYILEPRDWVNIAAFDKDNRVLLTRQYRHGLKKVCLELPCGVMEDGEKPEAAVLRELKEETGATVESLEALPPLSPNPARNQNTNFAFLARGTTIVTPQELDPGEEIEFEFVSVPRVMTMIASGEFVQGLHVATLFLALERLGLTKL